MFVLVQFSFKISQLQLSIEIKFHVVGSYANWTREKDLTSLSLIYYGSKTKECSEALKIYSYVVFICT